MGSTEMFWFGFNFISNTNLKLCGQIPFFETFNLWLFQKYKYLPDYVYWSSEAFVALCVYISYTLLYLIGCYQPFQIRNETIRTYIIDIICLQKDCLGLTNSVYIRPFPAQAHNAQWLALVLHCKCLQTNDRWTNV